MNDEQKEERGAGEMNKRREKMADGKRYIIYYDFAAADEKSSEDSENTKKSEGEKNV